MVSSYFLSPHRGTEERMGRTSIKTHVSRQRPFNKWQGKKTNDAKVMTQQLPQVDQCPVSKQVTLDTPSQPPLFLLMQFLLLSIVLFGMETDPLVCFVYLAVSTALAQSDPAQTLFRVCVMTTGFDNSILTALMKTRSSCSKQHHN